MRTILWLVALLCLTPLHAQQGKTIFKINFNSDEFTLDETDLKVLDEVANKAVSNGYYELTIAAHTDNDGSNSYNMTLSGKRAGSVWNYLKSKNIDDKVMDIDWYGEKRPETTNTSDEGKSLNRRVEIELKQYTIKSVTDVLKHAGGDYTQRFVIDPRKANTIKGKGGTAITIPANAMVYADGSPLQTTEVVVELKEFPSGRDAVFNQLSTSSNGRMLESGGMFSINAYAGNRPLALKKGLEMGVSLPSGNMKNDMLVFSGVPGANGVTDWQATSTAFDPASSAKLFFLPDVKKLSKLITEVNQTEGDIIIGYELPLKLHKPVAPKKPVYNAYPDKATFFSFWQKLTKSRKKREAIYARVCKTIDEANQKIQLTYDKKMQNYCSQLDRCYQDSIKNEAAYKTFYKWLDEQKTMVTLARQDMEKQSFNTAVQKLIDNTRDKKMRKPVGAGVLTGFQFTPDEKYRYCGILAIEQKLSSIITMPIETIYKDFTTGNRFQVSVDSRERAMSGMYVNSNPYAEALVMNSTDIKGIFKTATDNYYAEKEKLGLLDQSTVQSVYNAGITGFGSINCDRFAAEQQAALVDVKVNCPKDVQISFFIPGTNSYLYAGRDKDNNYSVRLPKGQAATMVVVGIENGHPLFEKKALTVSKGLVLSARPKQVTIKVLNNEVSQI